MYHPLPQKTPSLLPLSQGLCNEIHPPSAQWMIASPWGGNPHRRQSSSQRNCRDYPPRSGPGSDTALLLFPGQCTPASTYKTNISINKKSCHVNFKLAHYCHLKDQFDFIQWSRLNQKLQLDETTKKLRSLITAGMAR